MYRSMLIVDDVFDEPMQFREHAISQPFPEHEGRLTFAGRNSAGPTMVPGFAEAVGQLVGEKLTVPQDPRFLHSYFRLTLDGESSRRQVHADPSSLWWVGVLYLTLPEYCQGGTLFYRHRELGLDRTPENEEDLEKVGVNSVADLLERDGNDMDKWEHTMTLPMRFNRLVLYRPWLWHTAGPGFGSSIEDGRLIQVFAFGRGQ
ncbi:MAG: DUF6445 family protein [Alphaproteobacteria bacterium]|nr:DUF6445 family protein [Alphaproteobacteria bacterium]